MPKGDAQRVWFPEMLARLRSEWRETMSFAALVELRDSLDTMLHQIRSERHISSPVFTCPKCGLRGPHGRAAGERSSDDTCGEKVCHCPTSKDKGTRTRVVQIPRPVRSGSLRKKSSV